MEDLAGGYRRLVVDVGTGDGRAAQRLAESDRRALIVGIDASADAMAQVSRRAARPSARGGLPNLLFVRAAIERPPRALRARADLVLVTFPWGSLARGVLGLDGAALAGLSALLRPDGTIHALLSIMSRDEARLSASPADVANVAAIAEAWAERGLILDAHRPATVADLRLADSTWARRLGREARLVTVLTGRRAPGPDAGLARPESGER